MKKFFSFLVSKQFLLNLLGVILIWGLAIWGTLSWIKSYGYFQQNVEIPNFLGKHMKDLDLFVKNKSISYEIFDSIYVDDAEPGTVISQIPAPTDSSGMPGKPNRKIKLTVVPMAPKQITMPDLVDKSKFIAVKVLNSLGLRYSETYEYAPAGKDFVLKQQYKGKKIDSGDMVPEGARIKLVISKGKGGSKESIPDLVGLTVKEAKQRMANRSLELTEDCDDCLSDEATQKSYIYRQNPKYKEGKTVATGTIISVWSKIEPPVDSLLGNDETK